MLLSLSTYIQKTQSLKELVIMGVSKYCPTTDITKLLTINTSIKKFKCAGRGLVHLFSLLEYQELLRRLPDTLEELALNIDIHLSKGDLQNLVETLKEVNQLRTMKGAFNSLQVNFGFKSAEGFYYNEY